MGKILLPNSKEDEQTTIPLINKIWELGIAIPLVSLFAVGVVYYSESGYLECFGISNEVVEIELTKNVSLLIVFIALGSLLLNEIRNSIIGYDSKAVAGYAVLAIVGWWICFTYLKNVGIITIFPLACMSVGSLYLETGERLMKGDYKVKRIRKLTNQMANVTL